ncbi:MAG: saccharopine dehydrogenase NADP-binding domain-containing protein [Planctomycetes bacterium]|nr:saccharopine dehydrogenase NADP-binding domain-containing protein [Planctomycetota bacterium]
MRVVILGAGLQAQAACYDLVQQQDVTEVVVADADAARARALAQRWRDPRVVAATLDAGDPAAAEALLKGARAALSAVPYRFNAGLARAAVRAGCSFCDLGGNNDVVAQELALDAQAREAGVTIVPDCGLAPGMVSVLAAHAVAAFDRVDELDIRVGGLPQQRGGLLDYSLVFSVEGLINEYVEDAVVLEGGEPRRVPSLDDIEALEFPAPFGTLEAFNTSGGTSTLPDTYRGKVRRLSYKTIRYPGHGKVFQAIKRLGLLSSAPVEVDGAAVRPRALFARLAGPALDRGEPDVVLVRLTALGTRDGKALRRVYEMIEYPDVEHGLTAMMRATAFPATIVLLMLARGEVAAKGALPQERCIDPRRFLDELARRDLVVRIQEA